MEIGECASSSAEPDIHRSGEQNELAKTFPVELGDYQAGGRIGVCNVETAWCVTAMSPRRATVGIAVFNQLNASGVPARGRFVRPMKLPEGSCPF